MLFLSKTIEASAWFTYTPPHTTNSVSFDGSIGEQWAKRVARASYGTHAHATLISLGRSGPLPAAVTQLALDLATEAIMLIHSED